MKLKSNYSRMLGVILTLFPFFVGGYYVFYTAAVAVILTVGLLFYFFVANKVKISRSFTGLVMAFIALMYLLTGFWAVDKSMFIHGFLKIFTVILFMLSVWQLDGDDKDGLLNCVPIGAASMTVITGICGFFDFGKSLFYDSLDDLHGAFEYANAFAVYLLAAVIVLIFNNWKWYAKLPCAAVCIWGIYKSNSRAVWLVGAGILLLIALRFICKRLKTKKAISAFFACAFLAVVVAMIIMYKIGYIDKIINYLNTDGSLNERYLYYSDALRYILKHPFGKGAYAFYFAQPQFQSAYYYAIDVHCDLLQIAIEAGILPALLFAAVIIKQLLSKNNSVMQKFVIGALFLHSLVDYDLQFTVLFFILVLCFEYDNYKTAEIKGKLIPIVLASVIIAFNAIIGMSAYYNFIGKHDKSVYLYKNTTSLLILMQSTNEQQAGYDYAKTILSLNDNIFEANNTLSGIYAANNRYDEAIEQMELVLDKDPRTMSHYEAYIDLLVDAIKYYDERGEEEQSLSCKQKIVGVNGRISELKKNTSQRGILYGRKQRFRIGKKYKSLIKQYKQQIGANN